MSESVNGYEAIWSGRTHQQLPFGARMDDESCMPKSYHEQDATRGNVGATAPVRLCNLATFATQSKMPESYITDVCASIGKLPWLVIKVL